MRYAVAVLLLLAGCPDRDDPRTEPQQSREERSEIPIGMNRDLDILFVIDDSGSMGEEQASLAANFQAFMDVLESVEGGLPNVHIGVVSSDVGTGAGPSTACPGDGDDGRLQATAPLPCTTPVGNFISDVANPDGTRTRNYWGTLPETFGCIARLGTFGCGLEQHLEAMKRALDGSNSGNEGFLRPEAYLMVVFVADEDDCSAFEPALFDLEDDALGPLHFRCTEYGVECDGQPIDRSARDYGVCTPRADSPYLHHPQAYVDFLKSLKEDPHQIIVAGIIGNPTPVSVYINPEGEPQLADSCSSASGSAWPAVRLEWFLRQFPYRNTFVSICQPDLTEALAQIAYTYASVGAPCLNGAVRADDLHPEMPGLQVACQVSLWRDRVEEVVARCAMADAATPVVPALGEPRCWWARPEPDACPDPSHLALYLEPQNRFEPPGTRLVARCLAD